jgi:adenylylsulfate kinase-like enzyme
MVFVTEHPSPILASRREGICAWLTGPSGDGKTTILERRTRRLIVHGGGRP